MFSTAELLFHKDIMLVASRASVVIKGVQVGEELVDRSTIFTFLECDERRSEHITALDTGLIDIAPSEAYICHAIVAQASTTDVHPTVLSDPDLCHWT
jgi:hypothetical protein